MFTCFVLSVFFFLLCLLRDHWDAFLIDKDYELLFYASIIYTEQRKMTSVGLRKKKILKRRGQTRSIKKLLIFWNWKNFFNNNFLNQVRKWTRSEVFHCFTFSFQLSSIFIIKLNAWFMFLFYSLFPVFPVELHKILWR